MIAYKFLSAGAVAPFTGYRWPLPGPSGAGAWIAAADARPHHGVHACRAADLAFWVDAELWRIELADPVRQGQRQIIGRRGRLLDRVASWDAAMAHAFAEACVWRARDRSAASLRRSSLVEAAERLAGCSSITELRSVSSALVARGGLTAALAGYLAETVDFLLAGDPACSAYISARSAVVAEGGDEDAFGREREQQGSLLAERLGLTQADV